MGATISHLITSLQKASMYGRRGLSSNVGNRSLPTTTSSSACARFCACGKRTRARKREVIEDIVSMIDVRKRTEWQILRRSTVSKPAEKKSCKFDVFDS
jgi:hypothetical protein